MKIDLNNSRKDLNVYLDSGKFVLDMTSVAALEPTRKKIYAHLQAIADLYAKGTDVDRDHVKDTWSEIYDAFGDAYKKATGDCRAAGGSKKEQTAAGAQYRNGRSAAAEALKNNFAKHNRHVDLARGKFAVTSMTPDQVMARKGQTGTKARKAAQKAVSADKGAGKITGTAAAQNPSPAAKSVSNLEQAAALIKAMNLEELQIHLKAVESAIRVTERETVVQAKARAKRQTKRQTATA